MGAKVYLLFVVPDGRCDEAIQVLQRNAGVMAAEQLEDPPNVIMAVIEAARRTELADLPVRTIASVENMIEVYELMPVRDGAVSFYRQPVKTGAR